MTLRIQKEEARTMPAIRKTLSENLIQKERPNEETRKIVTFILAGNTR